MQLSDRYARQTALTEIGADGQEKLHNARVLIVGVGGLGSPISLYLAAAGVGTLGLIDDDVVSVSNLQRQVLYTEAEVGCSKVVCATRRLHSLNSEITIHPYETRLTQENATELITRYDIVVDGCDNFETRYILSDTCERLNKPYVYGAIQGFEGQVSVFCHGSHAKTYRNLYPNQDGKMERHKVDKSVIGVTASVVGSIEANEVLKLICGHGELLAGKLWTIDLRTLQTYILTL